MDPKNFEDLYSVSPGQSAILSQEAPGPESGLYCRQLRCRLIGNLDVATFERAWQHVLNRHTLLRTSFLWKRLDSPLQVVHRQVQFSLASYDLRGLPLDQKGRNLDDLLEEELHRGIDPLRAPLMRVALCRMEDESYYLIGTFHSLVADSRSLYLFLKDVLVCYRSFRDGRDSEPEASYPYWNYIDWLNRQDLDGAGPFWTESLKGVSTPTPLAISRAAVPSAGRNIVYAEERIELSPELAESLQARSKEYGLKFGTLIQGAWALLLGRYSGEEDVVFGLAVSGRPKDLEGAESMPGPLDNTLPARVRIPREARISSWLKTLEERMTGMRSYEFSPLDQVREWSDVPRELPLFESVVVSDDPPAETSLEGPWAGVGIADIGVFPSEASPITLKVSNGKILNESGPVLSITYERDRFDADGIRRMLGHLQVILGGLASAPDRNIESLPLLTGDELRLLIEPNRAATEYRRNLRTIHERVEIQQEMMPDRVAVTFEDERVTYAELNRRANQLAHHLLRLGVKLEDRVGICVERSVEMIVGMLGILKAGGSYVPLDPAYPKQRLEFMLDDTAASVVLTQQHLKDSLPERPVSVVCLDSDWPLIARNQEHNPDTAASIDNAAYVIYTSGSTGNPKGVTVTHRNVGRLFEGTSEWFDFDHDDTWTMFHSYAFDFSVWEIWGALMYGGRLVVVPYLVSRSPEAFLDLLIDEKVTVLNQTPSAFRQLIHADEGSDRSHGLNLRRVIFGGEALELQSLKPWIQRHGDERIQLINMYGITETTVHVTYRRIKEEDLLHGGSVVGVPIPDLRVYILDKRMQMVPIGIDGEMYVAGEGLARGYLNRADLTPERFIPDSFGNKPGGRLYKTGDLARYRPDGDIEFLGRKDLQVKLRGFRVELGEIEAVLRENPQVMEAVVVARQDHSEDTRLVAYIFGNSESLPGVGELKDAARKKLPDYMVPSDYVMLQDIPLTPNGKIDRRALPAPGRVSVESEDILLPRDTVELQLTQIWEEVLGVQPIGLENSFFDLGGHSMLAVRLMIRVEQEFGEKLPVASLFQSPTVEGLARLIRQRGSGTSSSSLVRIQPKGREQPFFCVHPSGGNVFCYTALAQCLGPEQPFYGLQAQGLDGTKPVHTRIEDMAAHYIEALREIQPSGPYLLGGWSMGGVVAFDMARQIEEQGEEVSLLVLMDARNPLLDRDLQEEKEDVAQLEGFAVQIGVPPDYLKAGRERILQCTAEARLSVILEQAKMVNVLRSDLDISQMRTLFDVFSSNIQALRSYVPRTRRGRMVLLKAARSKGDGGWDSSLGWGELATEGVEIYEVPGNHFGMMRSPNVRHLADRLAACIRKASPVTAAV